MTRAQLKRLLKHQSFLRSLARSLLRDAARADDLVQEAWLVALRSEKRPDEIRRGWLAGIVRNLARRAWRDDRRRLRRERVAARGESVRATDDVLAEASLRRRLAELVVALPERYREVVLLRYYDGLTPARIGARLELPPSTVRTRLQRGLRRIREQLEREHGRRTLGWLLVPLATGAAAPAAVARPALVAAAAVVAVSLLVWSGASDPPGRAAREGGTADVAEEAAAGAGPGRNVPAAPADAPETAPLRMLCGEVLLPRGIPVAGVVLDVSGRRHVVDGNRPFRVPLPEGDELELRASHPDTLDRWVDLRPPFPYVVLRLERRPLLPPEALAPAEVQDSTGDPPECIRPADSERALCRGFVLQPTVSLSGVVHLPEGAAPDFARLHVSGAWKSVRAGAPFRLRYQSLVRPAVLRIVASHPETLPVHLELPVLVDPATGEASVRFFEIALKRAVTIEGVVEVAGEGPAAGVTVAAHGFAGDAPDEEPLHATTTDAEGRFSIGIEEGRRHFLAFAAKGLAPRGLVVADPAAPLSTVVLDAGSAIDGAAHAEGVVRARLAAPAEHRLAGLELEWTPEGVAWLETEADVADDGRFLLGGLEPGATYEVALVRRVPVGTRTVVAPATIEFAERPARLALDVLPPDATVRIGDRAFALDDRGRLELDAAPGTPLRVTVSAPGFAEVARTVEPPAALRLELQRAAPAAVLELAPAAAAGTPLPAAAAVLLAPLDWGRPTLQRQAALEEGRYVLRDLDPGDYFALVLPGGQRALDGDGGYYLSATVTARLAAGAVTRASFPLVAGGRVAVALPDGLPAGVRIEAPFGFAAAVVAESWDLAFAPVAAMRGGPWVSPLLAPGRYTLVIEPWDRALPVREQIVEVRAGETTLVR